MRIGAIFLATFVLSGIGHAQNVSVGVEGSVPFRTPFYSTQGVPFAIGPTVEVKLFPNLSIATGAIYRRFGDYNSSFAFTTQNGGSVIGLNSWSGWSLDIPLLAKMRLLSEQRTFRPYFAAGPIIRRTSLSNRFNSSILTGENIAPAYLPNYIRKPSDWNVDPGVAAGVDIRAGKFHIEPELRYSYFRAGTDSPLRKNQVEFGIRFRR